MRNNHGLRSIIYLLARVGLVAFSCIALFTGAFISLSLRADVGDQSPLNPIGLVVFLIIFAIAVAGILFVLWLILRENRWKQQDSAEDKSKNV